MSGYTIHLLFHELYEYNVASLSSQHCWYCHFEFIEHTFGVHCIGLLFGLCWILSTVALRLKSLVVEIFKVFTYMSVCHKDI